MPTVTATTTTEVKIAPALKRKVMLEVKEYLTLKAQRDAIDHAMKGCRGKVESVLVDLGQDSVTIDGHKLTMVAPKRKVFDPMKFVSLGGNLDIYTASHEEKAGAMYCKITAPGSRDAEE